MEIKVGKRYRLRNNSIVRIVCTDRLGLYPVLGLLQTTDNSEGILTFTKDGKFDSMPGEGLQDIAAEVNPWNDVPMDAPVMCWDTEVEDAAARHFAGCNDSGEPLVWANGRTSHTEPSRDRAVTFKNVMLADEFKARYGK